MPYDKYRALREGRYGVNASCDWSDRRYDGGANEHHECFTKNDQELERGPKIVRVVTTKEMMLTNILKIATQHTLANTHNTNALHNLEKFNIRDTSNLL